MSDEQKEMVFKACYTARQLALDREGTLAEKQAKRYDELFAYIESKNLVAEYYSFVKLNLM